MEFVIDSESEKDKWLRDSLKRKSIAWTNAFFECVASLPLVKGLKSFCANRIEKTLRIGALTDYAYPNEVRVSFVECILFILCKDERQFVETCLKVLKESSHPVTEEWCEHVHDGFMRTRWLVVMKHSLHSFKRERWTKQNGFRD